MPSLAETTPDTTEELAHFRERWIDEIRERGQQHSSASTSGQPDPPNRLTSALSTYALAVSKEQSGDHPEATRLYRSAFRLDPNVDKAYYREECARQRRRNSITSSALPVSLASLSLVDAKAFTPSQTVPEFDTFASLLQSWPQPLLFTPDDESMGVPLNRLPDELIVSILYTLALVSDTGAIERFAAVSRRARILSLDMSIWRQIVKSTMVPSQLSDPAISLRKLAERYRFDYRRLYIEHPRLRFDGVYISRCHYVRNGLAENPWITISHLITYRRFLRFLPNGEVLSYRVNGDQDTGEIVHALRPGLDLKDLCIGHWQLMGTRVLVTDLIATPSAGRMGSGKYCFQMNLTLTSLPSLGRWNKLKFLAYESVHLETGETDSFSLRHERPYWFSKVKSYQWC